MPSKPRRGGGAYLETVRDEGGNPLIRAPECFDVKALRGLKGSGIPKKVCSQLEDRTKPVFKFWGEQKTPAQARSDKRIENRVKRPTKVPFSHLLLLLEAGG